ncbi:multidrug effflux MFS transporter [Jannaschia rubra]|uniref:multidrug effflux MFS transporter n=1 Tax=Jannaschia rubra TaxID=282197 RepID=UPI0024930A53|nr:multidrug effflux MFS transporter [Jannaschia rubra]
MATLNDLPSLRPVRSPPHILTLVALVGVSTLSMNLFLPSLPAMAAHFSTTDAIMGLSVGLYLAVNAVLQLFVGPVSDRYGRRPVILTGLVLFMLATLGCLWAPTIGIFLAFRMAQAFVVAAMVLSRAVVRDLYPQDKAASMLGYVTMGMSVVPMLAPYVGGVLETSFGWKANFWLLLAAGAGLWLLTWRDLGETAPRSTASLFAQVRQYPALLTSRRFWGYCAASAFASGSFFAYLGGAPFVGRQVFGMSPETLGLFFGAPAVGYMIGNGISGRYSAIYGIDRMIVTGCLGQAGGLVALALLTASGFTSHWVFFGFMTFLGLGNGLVVPNATAGMLSVRPHLAGTASGLGGAMMLGVGAAMSVIAAWLTQAASGTLPLLLLMVASGMCGLAAIVLTIRRNRQVASGSGL